MKKQQQEKQKVVAHKKNEEISKPPIQYKDANYCMENAIRVFNECDNKLKLYLNCDSKIDRKDTAKALLKILDEIKEILLLMNHGTYEDKTKNYYLTYNGTIYIFDICQFLRKSVFASLTIGIEY